MTDVLLKRDVVLTYLPSSTAPELRDARFMIYLV